MPKGIVHTLEVFIIGVLVTAVGALVDGFANYHPTGTTATIWGMVGLLVTGGLKGLYSWLITKQTTVEKSNG